MKKEASLKNKLILLIILSIAAGLLYVFPKNPTPEQKVSANTKEKTNKDTVKCQDTDLSAITDSQRAEKVNSCMFVGCSDFNF